MPGDLIAGKGTLRAVVVEDKPAPEISAEELLALRERLHLSRQAFALAPFPVTDKKGPAVEYERKSR